MRTICDAIVPLFTLRQPLLTGTATAVLSALVSGHDTNLRAQDLAALLQAITSSEVAWETKDADTLLSLARLVEAGFLR